MSKTKKVFENSILYTLSSLLVKAISFLLLPIYTLFLTPKDYGIIDLINSFNQIAIYVVSFSLFSALIRFYTDFKENNEKLRKLYGTIIIFVFFTSVIFFSVAVFLRKYFVDWFFEGINFFPMVFIGFFSLVFYAQHTIHQSILMGRQEGKKLTIINLVVFFFQVLITLFFIAWLKLGALGFLLAGFALNFFYFLFMLVDLSRNNLISYKINSNILKETLNYSIPLMPHNLSSNIASFASKIFINKEGNLTSVGLYGIASQIGFVVDLVQSSVNQAFSPWFFEKIDSGSMECKKDVVEFSNLLLVFYSFVYMCIGLFSQEVIILMTKENFHSAWKVIPVLVTSYSIKSIYYFYVNILFYYKKASKYIFLATLSGSFTDVFLAFIFVPIFGMFGAALSFLLAKVLIVMIVFFVSKKINDIGYSIVNMLRIILPSLIFMVVGLYFSYTKFVTGFNLHNFLFKIIILCLYSIFVYYSNRQKINELIKKVFLKKS